MAKSFDENIPRYITDAIDAMELIISGSQKETMELFMKVTRGEAYVLRVLMKNTRPMSPGELSEELGTTKGRVSSILKTLEKKGEIVREVDPDNRRNVIVKITMEGRQRIIWEMMEVRRRLIRVFRDMGEEDTKEIERLTKKFVDLL